MVSYLVFHIKEKKQAEGIQNRVLRKIPGPKRE
jgi:hypothetical protein